MVDVSSTSCENAPNGALSLVEVVRVGKERERREIDAIVAFLGTLTDARYVGKVASQPAPRGIRDRRSHTSVSASKKIDPDIFD